MLTLERAKELLNSTTTQEHLFLHAKNVSVARITVRNVVTKTVAIKRQKQIKKEKMCILRNSTFSLL